MKITRDNLDGIVFLEYTKEYTIQYDHKSDKTTIKWYHGDGGFTNSYTTDYVLERLNDETCEWKVLTSKTEFYDIY